ncbi:hypothetical protein [Rubripirellula reticaptiva]|uniref:Uncharacterized protein n=1 Tax=Rubripirellula reticaptiva TaxID=2528013 RepID=A0A5C6F5C4_9BACT|nr:hypothetical protein [Rubripirellula reticaptiva]TWU55740.1 hypothetical protein Poly59_20410 [Rubripirellula reticaptiva]
MSKNPFSPSLLIADEKGVCGDVRLVRSSFLFRVIDLGLPLPCRLTYSGWWFLQRVWIDDRKVWSTVSWLALARRIEFPLPADLDERRRTIRIEIDFRPGLMIRRFRVWVGEELALDQIS